MSTLGDTPDGPLYSLEEQLVGVPSSVQVAASLGEYIGPLNGNMVDVNRFQDQVVDIFGNPVQGDFQVNENVNELAFKPPDLPPTTAGPPWQGGTLPDNIGFIVPSPPAYNIVQQTFTVTYPSGLNINLSTVINQVAIYQSQTDYGSGLVMAGPIVVVP
jgi:hypothetical protein